ncbi:MAG: SDR family oxidoreductase [Phycisphaeraceae bacterium]|nr:SDR family oxidoreductase [Phycisphaeraceae bacterium]MCB9847198.1 SDR family oxidoreductase [Phycisphaeraceae bacterium]
MSILSNKVAIVTGASSGIGQAIAAELGRRQVAVVCAARRVDRLDSLATTITSNGGRAIAVPCDVTDRDDANKLAHMARETFGGIDILINNAGVMPLSHMAKNRVEDWERMVSVNIMGILYCLGAVLPHMIDAGAGHIVNVSSVAGRKVIPGAAVYCGTKHFVHALSEGLRSELAENNIRVTNIAPGYVATELQSHITDKDILERFKAYDNIKPLTSEDIACCTLHALEAPPHVNINEILVRPTAQAL